MRSAGANSSGEFLGRREFLGRPQNEKRRHIADAQVDEISLL
jgi:hypothetical protein